MNISISTYRSRQLSLFTLLLTIISVSAHNNVYKERLDSIVIYGTLPRKYIYSYNADNKLSYRTEYAFQCDSSKWEEEIVTRFEHSNNAIGTIECFIENEAGEDMCVLKKQYDKHNNLIEKSTFGIHPGTIKWKRFLNNFFYYNTKNELITYIKCDTRNNTSKLVERIDYTYSKGKRTKCRHSMPIQETELHELQRSAIIKPDLWKKSDCGRYDKNGNIIWHQINNHANTLTYTYNTYGLPQQISRHGQITTIPALFKYNEEKDVYFINRSDISDTGFIHNDEIYTISYNNEVPNTDIECLSKWYDYIPYTITSLFYTNKIDLYEYIHHKIMSIRLCPVLTDTKFEAKFFYSPIK